MPLTNGDTDLALVPGAAEDAAFLRIVFGEMASDARCECGRPLRQDDIRLIDVRGLSQPTRGRPVLATTRCTRRWRAHRYSALARLDAGPGIPLTRFGRSVL